MPAHNFYPNFHINKSRLRLNVTCPLQDFPSNCLSEESDATNLMLPLWSGLWDSKHRYFHPSLCMIYPEIWPKPGIHTPNCLKKWTEEQEGLAPHLRKPPPSPPPGIKLQSIQCQLDLKWIGLNLYENCIKSSEWWNYFFQLWKLHLPVSWVGRSWENSTGRPFFVNIWFRPSISYIIAIKKSWYLNNPTMMMKIEMKLCEMSASLKSIQTLLYWLKRTLGRQFNGGTRLCWKNAITAKGNFVLTLPYILIGGLLSLSSK